MDYNLLNRITASTLSAAERWVLVIVADYLGANDRAWPSHSMIATKTGYSKRGVTGVMLRLESLGILIPQRLTHRNEYRLAASKIPLAEPGSVNGVRRVGERRSPISRAESVKPVHRPGEPASPPEGTPFTDPVNAVHHSTPIHPPAPIQPLILSEPPAEKETEPWRAFNRAQASEANLIAIPLLADPGFRTAWQHYCEHRTAQACKVRTEAEAVVWTPETASAVMRQCETHAQRVGWLAIAERIDQAIGSRWKNLNFGQLTTPAAPATPPSAPKNGW